MYWYLLFFLLGIFCNTPYNYLHYTFEYKNDKNALEEIYQENFLFIEASNECMEYQIILGNLLSEPFFFVKEFQNLLLYEKQFFWIRAYLKNKSQNEIKLNSIYLLKNKEKILPYNSDLQNFIKHFPMYLNRRPLFWYLIPKDPALYFFYNYEWWEDFYTNQNEPKYNLKKIDYYSEYFSNQDWFILRPEKEVLFFIIFPNIIEDLHEIYTFNIEWKNCKIEIPFLYKIETTKEIKQKKETQKIIQKLRMQNIEWENKMQKKLREHSFRRKYFLDILFED